MPVNQEIKNSSLVYWHCWGIPPSPLNNTNLQSVATHFKMNALKFLSYKFSSSTRPTGTCIKGYPLGITYRKNHLMTIQLPFRLEAILSMTFLLCKETNERSIVLLVTPILAANSSAVYAAFSISRDTTFFSVLFKETLLPTLLPTFSFF